MANENNKPPIPEKPKWLSTKARNRSYSVDHYGNNSSNVKGKDSLVSQRVKQFGAAFVQNENKNTFAYISKLNPY